MDLSAWIVTGTNNSNKQVSVTKWNDLLTELEEGVRVIDVGTAGLTGVTPVVKISGGGSTSHSTQLTLRNERDGAGAGNDYENEVHLRLQAGTTTNHRRYFDFCGYSGSIDWVMGVNASDVFILNTSTDGHKMHVIPTDAPAPFDAYAGYTFLTSGGTKPVVINGGPNDGDTYGTGGFQVDAGGAMPRSVLFKVRPYVDSGALPVLQAYSNSGGYAPASLQLTAEAASIRGQGVFMRNEVADTSWYSGVSYNAASLVYGIHYASQAAFDPIVADSASRLLSLDTSGNMVVNGYAKTAPKTVATLVAAGTAGAGARSFVTDANATTFASIVAGGGANGVPVYSDGTNWRIG